MFNLFKSISSFLPRLESQAERDEAYLNQAVDLYDLERRMRDLDARAHGTADMLRLGVIGR